MTTTSDNIAAISKVLEGAELAKRECVFAAQEARKANGSDTYSSRVLDKASTVIDGLVSAILAEARKAEALKREIAELAKVVLEVLSAVRDYLPPDGISAKDCLSRVIGAVDNRDINPLIKKLEHGNVGA